MDSRRSKVRRRSALPLAGMAALLLAVPALRPQSSDPVRRAYPQTIPPDVSFETVVSSQPFPPVKYPVPVIGWKDHPEEVHVAPNGALVFPRDNVPGGLYLLPRLRAKAGPQLLDPNGVNQDLVDGYLPGVRSAWRAGAFTVRELAFATLLENPSVRTGRETLLTVARWTVKNGADQPEAVRLSFLVGRAVSELSLFKLPPSYPGKLSFHSPFVLDHNGRILLRVNAPGSAVVFSPASAKTDAGGTAQDELDVDVRLKPGEERTVDLFIPYFPIVIEKSGEMERLAVAPQLEVFRNFWGRELNRGAEFIIPEKRVRDSYRASLAYNMILVDREASGFLAPHPDATAYEHAWAGDSGCLIHAADRLGYHEEAAAYLDFFLARQGLRKPDGDVSSTDGFFSGDVPGVCWMGDNGFILWALAEHYKLTGDRLWLKRVAPRMIRSCDWIGRERARTKAGATPGAERPRHYGLLPKGRASDNDDLDYFYWTDTYSYAGLRGTADVLPEIGMAKEAARLRAEADDYKSCILDSVERSVVRDADPPFVPQGPYMNGPPTAERLAATWYGICSPVYMVEMGLFGAGDPKTAWVNRTIEKFVMTTGLPTIARPGYIDPHYVYDQALSQLLRGETERFLWTFYSLFAYGQARSTYATLEGNDIATGSSGEAWDSLRMPHMHSASRVLAMVRIALLLEDGETLHLLAGTPRGWLAPGRTIEVRRAPTHFGEAGLRCESRGVRREITAVVAPPLRKPARIILHVRPPSAFGPAKSVTVNGRPWPNVSGEAVDLGRLTSRAVVVCRY
ncbi:MAG TPA: hypothetical protein VMS75_03150 [Terriglobales bacterium]|nr:hypothetical protein [Terriglobales bacterium]